ncbi:MAG TPA: shikimate dehydrogenase [Acidimicrobiales bacterium]|nr:shikimate dehydrogenase [Acidimicrobiales bacterium]
MSHPRVCWVIGSPVEHSLSPVIHNAAFDALGLDWSYFAVAVPPGRAPAALAAMRSLRLGGLSVTMPHKEAVAAAVDVVTPRAERLGAVNCVAWRGTQLEGDSTDGPGFLDALRVDHGWDPAGRRALVVGAGGAARAVIAALAAGGAAAVGVANRSAERAARAAALAGPVGQVAGPEAVDGADLVVNATPQGMGGDTALPVDPARLGPGQVVADLVYDPVETPLLAAARAAGAVPVTGVGMLVHQAAHAFRRWTGEDPPVEVMSAAAVAALAARH